MTIYTRNCVMQMVMILIVMTIVIITQCNKLFTETLMLSPSETRGFINNNNNYHKNPDEENVEDFISTGRCNIIFHVHIPKTGGSSIRKSLKNMSNFQECNHMENLYVTHGRNVKKTLIPLLRKKLSDNTTILPILISAEIGITDLFKEGSYAPFFDQTCFFTTIRDPSQWVLSAENYMRVTSNYTGGIHGSWGYFDQPNIQSSMTSFGMKNSISSALRSGTICTYNIERVNDLICKLGNNCKGGNKLEKANGMVHSKNVTKEIIQLVQRKYWKDHELWRELSGRGGKFCW